MTEKLIRNENEAIEAIKSNIPTSGYYMLREALDMAISALEEIQQYRELGTVGRLKAKLAFLNAYERADSDGRMMLLLDKNGYCKELDATEEELREAREKQVPKKPITHKETNRADCPICGATARGVDKPFGNWCSKCGQAIDWSDAE